LIHLPKRDLIHLSPEAFKNMTRLKMFINRNACFSEKPNFFSNELRLLDWSNYPGESLPSNFCGKNLVVLTMPRSQLKELEGVQVELLFLIFLPLYYFANFFQTNLFHFFLTEFPKHDNYEFSWL
jgi:hypothetical protein